MIQKLPHTTSQKSITFSCKVKVFMKKGGHINQEKNFFCNKVYYSRCFMYKYFVHTEAGIKNGAKNRLRKVPFIAKKVRTILAKMFIT